MDFSAVGKKKVTRIDTKVPQLVATLDLAKAKEEFSDYLDAIDGIVEQASAHEVKDEDTAQYAVSMTKEVRDIEKRIEEKRKEIVKDPNEFVKNVNAFTKMFTGKLNTAETTLKHKIGQYQYKKELERKEAERKAQEEARKLQEALDKEAKEKGVETVQVVTPVMPKEKTITRTESGASAHIRMEWKAEVVNEKEVPRAFCSPDMTLIKQAVKMGVREIAGVRIFEAPITVIR